MYIGTYMITKTDAMERHRTRTVPTIRGGNLRGRFAPLLAASGTSWFCQIATASCLGVPNIVEDDCTR